MVKRKNEDETHQSRIDYDQNGDVEQRDGADAGMSSFSKADASIMASRRTVRRSTVSGGDGTGHDPKRFRREKYQKEMTALNAGFRRFIVKKEPEIRAEIAARAESGAVKEGPPEFFNDAVAQYIHKAAQIRAEYMPAIGDVLTCGTGEVGQLGWPEERLNNARTFYRPQLVSDLSGRRIISIASGAQFNLALTEEGRVFSWGCNDEGALGQCDYTKQHPPSIDTSYVPAQVKGFLSSPAPPGMSFVSRADEKIIAVAAGDCHALALSSTGRVHFFGSYKEKEGGGLWRDLPPSDDPRINIEVNLRSAEDVEEDKPPAQPPKGMQRWPIHVNQITGGVKKIACNASSNVAVLEDDTVVTWGLGQIGEMGRPMPPTKNEDGSYNLGAFRNQFLKPTPVVFGGPQNVDREIVQVSCGLYHTIVIVREYGGTSSDGLLRVYTCGLNNYGQLGRGLVGGKESENSDDEPPVIYDTLEPVVELDGRDIVKAAAGEHHSIFLDITGKGLYVCGRGDAGQLGITSAGELPDKYALEERPVPLYLVQGEENPFIAEISCGSFCTMANLENGEAYTWGFGENGTLGHGRPTKPQGEADINHLAKDEIRPRKLDVLSGVRKQEEKEGKSSSGKAKVQMISGGAQHSVFLVSREQ